MTPYLHRNADKRNTNTHSTERIARNILETVELEFGNVQMKLRNVFLLERSVTEGSTSSLVCSLQVQHLYLGIPVLSWSSGP